MTSEAAIVLQLSSLYNSHHFCFIAMVTNRLPLCNSTVSIICSLIYKSTITQCPVVAHFKSKCACDDQKIFKK